MKICKIIRIHDGKCETLQNGDFMLIDEFPRAQKIVNRLISEEGYEVVQVMPIYTPAERNDNLNFFRGGFVFYLEKEVSEEEYDEIMSELEDYKKGNYDPYGEDDSDDDLYDDDDFDVENIGFDFDDDEY